MDSTGFREIWLKDSQFSKSEGGQPGRFAWLIYDRHEPQQICHLEHFMGGGLPSGWKETGAGSSAGSSAPMNDTPGGVRRITTGTQQNDNRLLSGETNQWSFQRELHAEFYLAGMSSIANIMVYLGFADGDLLNVNTPPANMVVFFYNPNDGAPESPYWRVAIRSNGQWKYYVPSTVPGTAGKRFFRFEAWPAGQTAVDPNANVIIPYIDGNKVGTSPYLKDDPASGVPIPWTNLMRPFFFVQTLQTGAARSIDVDAFKAFENETWRY